MGTHENMLHSMLIQCPGQGEGPSVRSIKAKYRLSIETVDSLIDGFYKKKPWTAIYSSSIEPMHWKA